jgi:L-fucose isomerase-like protein
VAAADRGALTAGARLHLALKQAARDQHLDAFAAECWTGLPRELGLNPCLGFVEDAYTLACEGDVVLAVSLLIVRYLTGTRAYVGDLYDLDLDGRLTLVHCGGPASLAANNAAVVLAKSELAQQRGFETITCRPRLPAGPVTLFRLYGPNCDQLHMALGDLTGCEQSPNLSVAVQLAGSRWDFLSQCFGNHYVVAPGDIRPELILLSKWLGIQVSET